MQKSYLCLFKKAHVWYSRACRNKKESKHTKSKGDGFTFKVPIPLVAAKGKKSLFLLDEHNSFLLDEHNSPQWYDIVHFEHMLSWALLWASPKGLIPMERVFLDYKLMIIL